jgi:hypothetical protein
MRPTAALAALLALAAADRPARAGDAPPAEGRGFVSLIWENDIFDGEDKKYTNGAFLRYTAPEGRLHAWARGLRGATEGFLPPAEWRMAYGLGHAMFTAADITDPDPPETDRPYAAAFVGSASLFADSGDRLDSLTLDLALVGPAALGEEIQSWVHDNILGDEPKGWDTQLENELAFRVLYEQTRRVALPDPGGGFQIDVLPRASVALGTLETSAGAGAMLRIGENLRADYGPDRVRRGVAGPGFAGGGGRGWQLYAGLDGLAVARNLFLDGNTFRDSRSVDREPIVAEATVGAAYVWDDVVLSYTHVIRSEEFETQEEPAAFGSLNLRIAF